jgi:hypothetical protein
LWFGEDGPAIPFRFLSPLGVTARRGELTAVEGIAVRPATLTCQRIV